MVVKCSTQFHPIVVNFELGVEVYLYLSIDCPWTSSCSLFAYWYRFKFLNLKNRNLAYVGPASWTNIFREWQLELLSLFPSQICRGLQEAATFRKSCFNQPHPPAFARPHDRIDSGEQFYLLTWYLEMPCWINYCKNSWTGSIIIIITSD